jgi:hypothetical protein
MTWAAIRWKLRQKYSQLRSLVGGGRFVCQVEPDIRFVARSDDEFSHLLFVYKGHEMTELRWCRRWLSPGDSAIPDVPSREPWQGRSLRAGFYVQLNSFLPDRVRSSIKRRFNLTFWSNAICRPKALVNMLRQCSHDLFTFGGGRLGANAVYGSPSPIVHIVAR